MHLLNHYIKKGDILLKNDCKLSIHDRLYKKQELRNMLNTIIDDKISTINIKTKDEIDQWKERLSDPNTGRSLNK